MDSNNSSSTKLDVYQIVTDRIVQLLERGTVPWQKPWNDVGIPRNLLSKRPYRGINLWLLLSLNYERNLFLTWDQIKKYGGTVVKGEKGHIVIYWKSLKKVDGIEDDEKKKNAPLLRYYKVFNISQCSNLPNELVEVFAMLKHDTLFECEAVVKDMPQCPVIRHKEQEAYYHIKDDYINMPKKKGFKSIEYYYSTLFHELVHSTGHEKRLNRPTITEMAEFGSEKYGIEELVAEMGAAFLCSQTGILQTSIQNSSAYIDGWLDKLKRDKRFVVKAAGQAQRAVDFIIKQSVSAAQVDDQTEHSELLKEN